MEELPQAKPRKLTSNKPEPLKAQIIAKSLNGESNTQIARDLHLCRQTVSRILREAEINSVSMPQLLRRHGITGEVLIEKYIKPGLDAMQTEFAKFEGKITDSQDVIAWGPRHDYLETTLKLGGFYPAEEKKGTTNIGIQVTVEHISGSPHPAAT